jgi:hypothetical protein
MRTWYHSKSDRIPISMTAMRSLTLITVVGALALVGAQSLRADNGSVRSVSVGVTLRDATFRLSNMNLGAGRTTFIVRNAGNKQHAFEISGPGVKKQRTKSLAPGSSTSLVVSLRSGAYVLSDPVGLSSYNVQFLSVVPSADVKGSGTSSVVAPPGNSASMCGVTIPGA